MDGLSSPSASDLCGTLPLARGTRNGSWRGDNLSTAGWGRPAQSSNSSLSFHQNDDPPSIANNGRILCTMQVVYLHCEELS